MYNIDTVSQILAERFKLRFTRSGCQAMAQFNWKIKDGGILIGTDTIVFSTKDFQEYYNSEDYTEEEVIMELSRCMAKKYPRKYRVWMI